MLERHTTAVKDITQSSARLSHQQVCQVRRGWHVFISCNVLFHVPRAVHAGTPHHLCQSIRISMVLDNTGQPDICLEVQNNALSRVILENSQAGHGDGSGETGGEVEGNVSRISRVAAGSNLNRRTGHLGVRTRMTPALKMRFRSRNKGTHPFTVDHRSAHTATSPRLRRSCAGAGHLLTT
jgi:hypothetical protein